MEAVSAPRLPAGRGGGRPSVASGVFALAQRGLVSVYLGALVVMPLAAVVARSFEEGPADFWAAISTSQAAHALVLTALVSLAVVAVNAVFGTLIAWVLVRDEFPGKGIVNAAIDLPFALPTVVAGITMLALYGPRSPLGVNAAFSKAGILLALLFVTLPFVVRAVQPVLLELDREVEEAAASLGASPWAIVRRIILPSIAPAALAGAGLAFARAIGEFGSVVLIAGNIPNKTEVAAVFIFGKIESGNETAAAAVSVVLLAGTLLVLAGVAFLSRRVQPNDG